MAIEIQCPSCCAAGVECALNSFTVALLGQKTGTWLERAAALAIRWVPLSLKLANLAGDKRISDKNRLHNAETIEDEFVAGDSETPGGTYCAKFCQGDSCDLVHAFNQYECWAHLTKPDLFIGCAVGPGPVLVMLLFLFMTEHRTTGLNRVDRLQVLRWLYLRILRLMCSEESLGLLLLETWHGYAIVTGL